MRKIIRIFIFFIVLFPLTCIANGTSENVLNPISEASPAQVVEDFYHNYLIAINTSDRKMGNNAIDIYVTQRLKDEIDSSDIDWDYYIDAQDICDFWMGNIKVEQVEVLNNKAKMKLTLGNESCKSIYKIKLLKDSSGWKIDNVVLLKRFNKLVK